MKYMIFYFLYFGQYFITNSQKKYLMETRYYIFETVTDFY